MPPYIVYGDCSERKGIKEEEEKRAPLSGRLSLKPVEERWGQPKGKINQDVSKSRMVQQGCIARERRGGEEEGRRICCSYTVVLFHAPFRAENYSGARDSLWECILNGSERTANDTRDCTFHPVSPFYHLHQPPLRFGLTFSHNTPSLVDTPRVFSTSSSHLSFVPCNFLSLSISLSRFYNIFYIRWTHVQTIKKYYPFSRLSCNRTSVEIVAFVKIWKYYLLQKYYLSTVIAYIT